MTCWALNLASVFYQGGRAGLAGLATVPSVGRTGRLSITILALRSLCQLEKKSRTAERNTGLGSFIASRH